MKVSERALPSTAYTVAAETPYKGRNLENRGTVTWNDGSLDLNYNGKAHFTKLYFPGYQPLAGSRFAIGARTGGLNANHWYDDLSIETYLAPQPGIVKSPQDIRVVEGSSATFSVVLNNGDASTVQWLRNGQVIAGENGECVALEVNVRPPGGYSLDMMNWACDIDLRQAASTSGGLHRLQAGCIDFRQAAPPGAGRRSAPRTVRLPRSIPSNRDRRGSP